MGSSGSPRRDSAQSSLLSPAIGSPASTGARAGANSGGGGDVARKSGLSKAGRETSSDSPLQTESGLEASTQTGATSGTAARHFHESPSPTTLALGNVSTQPAAAAVIPAVDSGADSSDVVGGLWPREGNRDKEQEPQQEQEYSYQDQQQYENRDVEEDKEHDIGPRIDYDAVGVERDVWGSPR